MVGGNGKKKTTKKKSKRVAKNGTGPKKKAGMAPRPPKKPKKNKSIYV
jgi:hypothetical protein